MSQDIYQRHHQRALTILQNVERRTRLKPLELAILSIYPVTVLLGQVIHKTSYELTSNYYTNKHNILNTLFVKRGWFWTLLVLVYLKIQNFFKIPNRNPKELIFFFSRVAIGTIWWVLFTQWFFGVPIMDRIFILTGGVCQYDPLGVDSKSGKVLGTIGSVLCRKLKGVWIGGHDPSGHVFLLVHGSIMLWFELLEIGAVRELHEFVEKFRVIQRYEVNSLAKFQKLGILFLKTSSVLLILLLALWWWMLLVTSTHFHSFIEKITGLVAAYLGLSIYLIPRFL